MYRLQWAYVCNEDGSPIGATDFVYHDTVFEYEDLEEARQDRAEMMRKVKDKYIRVVEV